MRCGWRRFWRLDSTAAVVAGMIAFAAALGYAQSATGYRHNELTLAGLRPGASKLSMKRKFSGFGTPHANATGYQWRNHCDGRILTVEMNDGRVETVTVSTLGPVYGDCLHQDEGKQRASLKTGRGLGLGDSCRRVTELYGKPESRGPSVQGSRKLELLFYSFDWAGENVPQSMEVSCDDASRRVLEITLASSSL